MGDNVVLKDALYYKINKKNVQEAFLEFVYEWEFKQVNSIVSMCELTNLETGVREKGIMLDRIMVYPLLRDKGLGTQYLTEFLLLADIYHQTLFLFPSDALGAELDRLIKYYERFGFILNKRDNKIYKDYNGMYRPKKNGDVL